MTDPTTALAAIQARADAATEGPWEETWRPIPGLETYEVSDFGNVRSFLRAGNHKDKISPKPRTLAQYSNAFGYRTVSLPSALGGAAYKTRRVHHLVMLAFVGDRPAGMEIAHLNGDPSDNRLTNLAYVTHAENEAHKVAHGTSPRGERNGQAKLQGWQVAEIKYLADKSVPQGKIAALFDISHKQVSEILCGVNWRDTPARTDVPRLVKALQDVLAEHSSPYGDCCPTCTDENDNPLAKPCPTVRVIAAALGRDIGDMAHLCRTPREPDVTIPGGCPCGFWSARNCRDIGDMAHLCRTPKESRPRPKLEAEIPHA